MKSFRRFSWSMLLLSFLVFLSFQVYAQVGSIPTPESIIGFEPGTDYKMANWDQVYAYFKALDTASDKVEVLEVGETEMGRPMIIALISSPENLRNKEKYKEIQRKLADPRLSSDSELPRLVEEGKSVMLVTCSLHATELGATQMSPVMAYQMATENTPVMTQILENVILVLFPSANPDGVQMTADHYMSQNPGPGVRVTGLPRLYSKYTGHDNNRDWYMLTQKESMIIAKQMYEEWFPEIVFDMHQKGGGSRIFLPPFADPLNPLIHPQIVREIQLLGGYMNSDLIDAGYPWVQNQSGFTMWWHGGMRTAPYYHNMVGVMSEAASANLASPTIPTEEQIARIRERPKPEPTINYPVPWVDDRPWRLIDIMTEDRIAVLAVLKAAARNKDMFIKNYYTMNKEAIEKGGTEKPYAFVMSADQHDIGAMVYFIETMLKQDTDFHLATRGFNAGGKRYPAESVIVYLAQPTRPNILGIMDTQIYPSGRRPYDITGWTLPLQMGVEYDRIDEPFNARTRPYTIAEPFSRGGTQEAPRAYYIGGNSIDHFKALNRLFKKNYSASIISEPYTVNEQEFPPGSIVLDVQGNIAGDIAELKKDLSLTIVESDAVDNSKKVALTKPRIGLIDNPSSMPVGWMRWVLENNEFDYALVNNEDFEKGNLNDNFDVLLFTITPQIPGGGGGRGRGQPAAQQITEEERLALEEMQRQRQEAEQKVQQELRNFVQQGGTAVSWSGTVNYMIQTFDLGITDVQTSRDEFSIPGSILKINVDTSHPVTYGMQAETYIFFRNNRVLRTNESRVLGKYPGTNPLVSGYVLGPEVIQNTDNIIHETVGNGKVVLISFEPMFRAQPVGTFKLVFNSILYSVMPAVR